MGMWSRFIEQPRQAPARQWLFLVHQYLGLLLGVYFVAVSLSGSALVFRPEVELATVLRSHPPASAATGAGPLQSAWTNLRQQYPGQAISAFAMNQYPGRRAGDPYRVRVQSPARTSFVYVDTSTGQILGSQHPLIVWLQDLHFSLFSGRTGLIVNGAGAVLFAVMCLTGAVIWWPGKRNWRRGFGVRWSARWPSVNYDVHSLLGITSMALLAGVAAAGVYVAAQMLDEPDVQQIKWQASVNALPVDLDEVVRRAEKVVPDGIRVGLNLPAGPDDRFRFEKLLGDTRVRVFLAQHSGEVVHVDRIRDRSWVTWFSQVTSDLHYGRLLGTASRAVWVLLGAMPLMLLCTGVVMWWNRTGSKWYRRRRGSDEG